jgi:hypothetical protein
MALRFGVDAPWGKASRACPARTELAEEIRGALDEMVRTLGRTNPPVPAFFDRLRDLRAAAATLNPQARSEIRRLLFAD